MRAWVYWMNGPVLPLKSIDSRGSKHRLLGVDLENEVLQGPQADHRRHGVGLLLRAAVQLAELRGHLTSRLHHRLDQVVGIDHRPLARLHLSLGKLHHAVRQVRDVVAPRSIAQFLQHELQHLELVVLLVAYAVDHVVEAVVSGPPVTPAPILRPVD